MGHVAPKIRQDKGSYLYISSHLKLFLSFSYELKQPLACHDDQRRGWKDERYLSSILEQFITICRAKRIFDFL